MRADRSDSLGAVDQRNEARSAEGPGRKEEVLGRKAAEDQGKEAGGGGYGGREVEDHGKAVEEGGRGRRAEADVGH